MEEINTIIFEILNEVSPIRTTRASMFSPDDLYGHPPFLRFGFVLKNKELMSILQNNVDQFKGNLVWLTIMKNGSENCILIPRVFKEIQFENQFYKKDFWIKQFGENIYKLYVDAAIEDIPELAEYIKTTILNVS